MKKITFLFSIVLLLLPLSRQANSAHYAGERNGYILLQVEANGEAWYVYPQTSEMYYLGRPRDAFEVMKKLSLGAKHDYIVNTEIFPDRLAGMILLDVEANGEAYYIYPKNKNKYYLGRPADAFNIMRELGQGISNEGLANIPIGDLNKQIMADPMTEKVLIENVPFTPQAPFGDWSDQRQQDGCEEASSLMAVRWARGENLTYAEALEEILGASDYILEKYGEYRDINTADAIEWIYKDYFDFDNAVLKKNISIQDIVDELHKGNLAVTPMNGQIMHNPFFTSPGPERHMVVIRGYDPDKNTFITNDPGTRHGELYEYNTEVFYNAIRDYPTGYHLPIEKIEKNMIVVSKTDQLITPISDALERITKKPFGIQISPDNSPIQPERFSGYHTGVDFETYLSEAESDVNIYAICSGPLVYKNWINGYGGVAIQSCKLDGQDVTVLYGHLQLSSIEVSLNNNIQAGSRIGILGKGESTETDNERKHLHLGIHRGTKINLLGYVQTQEDLENWIDIADFLY